MANKHAHAHAHAHLDTINNFVNKIKFRLHFSNQPILLIAKITKYYFHSQNQHDFQCRQFHPDVLKSLSTSTLYEFEEIKEALKSFSLSVDKLQWSAILLSKLTTDLYISSTLRKMHIAYLCSRKPVDYPFRVWIRNLHHVSSYTIQISSPVNYYLIRSSRIHYYLFRISCAQVFLLHMQLRFSTRSMVS